MDWKHAYKMRINKVSHPRQGEYSWSNMFSYKLQGGIYRLQLGELQLSIIRVYSG